MGAFGSIQQASQNFVVAIELNWLYIKGCFGGFFHHRLYICVLIFARCPLLICTAQGQQRQITIFCFLFRAVKVLDLDDTHSNAGLDDASRSMLSEL